MKTKLTQRQLTRLVDAIVSKDRSLARFQACEIATHLMQREGFFKIALERAENPMVLNGIPRW